MERRKSGSSLGKKHREITKTGPGVHQTNQANNIVNTSNKLFFNKSPNKNPASTSNRGPKRHPPARSRAFERRQEDAEPHAAGHHGRRGAAKEPGLWIGSGDLRVFALHPPGASKDCVFWSRFEQPFVLAARQEKRLRCIKMNFPQ